MSTRGIVGLIMSIIGAIGVVYSAITISNDTSGLIYYTYTSPFTTHETTVIAILAISAIVLLIGIINIAKKDDAAKTN